MAKEVIFSKHDIDNMVGDIAFELNKIFKDSKEAPVFIGVLKGSAPFMMDLIKKLNFNLKIDFIQVSSYSGTQSTGVIHLKKDISENIKGKDIIIVEDIIDTGSTLHYLKQYFQINYQPRSIRIICLIDKKPLRKVELEADLVGATLNENKFIVGYGLDYKEFGRNLPEIIVPSKAQITERDRIAKKK